MARKQIAYHLGAHKTASSLLQKYMRDNPDVLRRHRIVYLSRSEMNDLVGWGKRLLTQPQLLEDRISELSADRRCRTLITSHENTLGPPLKPDGPHLYPRAPEIVTQLARVLERWPSRVILYIRPQDQFVESYYLQRIHQGDHITFEEWLEQVDLDALSWRPVVDALHERFGPDRVEIVDFGRIREGQNAFIADFFRRVDPALDLSPDYEPIRNASISDRGLKIALAANRHLRNDRERKKMRKFLQRHFSNRTSPRPVLLSPEQRAHLRDRYAAEYAELTGTRVDTGTPAGGDR